MSYKHGILREVVGFIAYYRGKWKWGIRTHISSWPRTLLLCKVQLDCSENFWTDDVKTWFRKGMPEESWRCLESSHHGHGMAMGALLEGPPWNSPPRAGHCFFKGQLVQLCNLLCKKGMIYLHPGLERKAGYMFSFQMVPNLPDEDYVDLT